MDYQDDKGAVGAPDYRYGGSIVQDGLQSLQETSCGTYCGWKVKL